MDNVIRKRDILLKKKVNWGILFTILGISSMALVKVIFNTNSSVFSIVITVISLVLLFDTSAVRNYKAPSRYVFWIFVYSLVTILLSFVYSFGTGHSFFERPFGLLYQGCYFLQIILLWNCRDLDLDHLMRLFFWYSGLLGVVAIVLMIREPSLSGGRFFITGLGNIEGETIVTRASTGVIGAYVVFSSLAYIRSKNKFESVIRYIFVGLGILVILLSNRRTTVGAVVIVLILHAVV